MGETSKESGVLENLVGVFMAPKETFQALDKKPTWWVPFLIVVIASMAMAFLTADINIQDTIAKMQAQERPQEVIDRVAEATQGFAKYAGLVAIPIVTLVILAALSGILWFGGNILMGGNTTFKKIFSLVCWTSLVGMVGGLVQTAWVIFKETRLGVTTSPAAFLPTPELSAKPSLLYSVLSKFDVFTIWSLVLWIVGLSVLYRFGTKKAATLVLGLWAVWIIASVALGGVLGGPFG
jgi:hypothetical protein